MEYQKLENGENQSKLEFLVKESPKTIASTVSNFFINTLLIYFKIVHPCTILVRDCKFE